jgi:Protein of unknown function (DUF2934)
MTPYSEAQIRDRAYALWEEAGRPDGQDMAFWIVAERELADHSHHYAPAETAMAETSIQPLPDQDMADQESNDGERFDEPPTH